MKCFTVVGDQVGEGIKIVPPFYGISLGQGGCAGERVFVPIRKRSVQRIVKSETQPCPRQRKVRKLKSDGLKVCKKCGVQYLDYGKGVLSGQQDVTRIQRHPNYGQTTLSAIMDVGIVPQKDRAGNINGKFIIIKPPNDPGDRRIVVLWRVASGLDGDISAESRAGGRIIAQARIRLPKKSRTVIVVETLAILAPGQQLVAYCSGFGVTPMWSLLHNEWNPRVVLGR